MIKNFSEYANQSVNEAKSYKANFDVVASKRLGDYVDTLKGFRNRTTSDEWKKKLTSAIKDIEKLEAKFVKMGTTLGSIPFN